ncbi:MAG: LPS export ABC transporter permease LptF [Gammaproteobacteria bacterium]|nr:LPS export ABC transporter permease LptF [Gammaproteobacteria bacterium]
MRILDKYLLKELLKTFLAVLTVLLLITFGSEATKLLALAVEGKIPSGIVLQVLLLKIPPALEIILPLVALLSVMLSVGRLYQDQEMVVLSSSGISPRYFQKITLLFLLPIALLTAWISLVVTPWSFQTERLLVQAAQSATPVSGLTAGRFNVLANNSGVFYTQSISTNGVLSNVWIQRKSEEGDVILVAPKGRFKFIDEQLVLILEDGTSYRGLHLSTKKSTSEPSKGLVQQFKRLEMVIPEMTATPSRPTKYEVLTTVLWNSDSNSAQSLLQWRMVTPLGVLVLGLIGLKMSRSGPRQGRFAKLFFALVIYIIYNQLLVVGRDGISDGSWSSTIGLWPIPLLFLLFALWEFKGLEYYRTRLFKAQHSLTDKPEESV